MIRTAILRVICFLSLAWGASVQALECRYCEGKDLGDLIELSVSRCALRSGAGLPKNTPIHPQDMWRAPGCLIKAAVI